MVCLGVVTETTWFMFGFKIPVSVTRNSLTLKRGLVQRSLIRQLPCYAGSDPKGTQGEKNIMF